MRFMVMHKVDAEMEAGERPDPGIIQGMGRLIGNSIKQGSFLDGAGLHRRCVCGFASTAIAPSSSADPTRVATSWSRPSRW